MIQVLRIGNYVNHSKREYKATCWRCNALLQFDHFDQLNDPIENGIYIRCPQCWAVLGNAGEMEMGRRMIQIEKHGNKYAFYKTTCPECGCQFIFSPLDTKKVYMCGGMIDYRYVKCPECDYNIDEINWDI